MHDDAKPKFSGSPRNLPLNAVMYVTKQSSNPVTWTNAVAIDCYIDPDGHIKINTYSPTAITWHNTLTDLNKQLGLQAQKNMIVGGTLKRIIVMKEINESQLKQFTTEQLEELARQTHFRGYYLLNADVINLVSSATGDFAFSAESGTVWMYESSWYDSGQLVPDQVTPASDELPIVNGIASAGISTSYSRGDHIYLKQLTYDGNVTATKFAKTGGISNDILLADGSTKQSVLTSKIYQITQQNSKQILEVDLVKYSLTCTGVTVLKMYGLYIMVMVVFQGQITNILTTDAQSALPTGGIYLGCNQDSITGTITDQWNISNTPTGELRIGVNTQIIQDNKGLMLSNDGQILTFNGKQFVDLTTDQTITGRKTFAGVTLGNIQLNPTDVSYGEGIRIANSAIGDINAIYIGTSHTSSSGEIDGQFTIIKRTNGSLTICRTADQNTANKGLVISTDGNKLSFNGSVIAGTGATSGANNGSVNYSAGNTILWGANSTDPIGEFCSDGVKVYWRAHPLTMGSVPP
ncbi:MAG: hypothetical protein EZS28_002845 [Streblomastix strix]|uniref:Uncharacterized protein n=1 Tax=Streblomastix strix TaxID=222440 RepID=A0A5J4X2S6_9EUKA|nr:MAG: hypothetical protein EZS28_002845 [Streblomastix strix]